MTRSFLDDGIYTRKWVHGTGVERLAKMLVYRGRVLDIYRQLWRAEEWFNGKPGEWAFERSLTANEVEMANRAQDVQL